MSKQVITSGDIEFYHDKSPVFLEDVDIKNVLVSNKISFREKKYKCILVTCMIIKLKSYKLKPLSIIIPKVNTYVKVMMVKLNGCIF